MKNSSLQAFHLTSDTILGNLSDIQDLFPGLKVSPDQLSICYSSSQTPRKILGLHLSEHLIWQLTTQSRSFVSQNLFLSSSQLTFAHGWALGDKSPTNRMNPLTFAESDEHWYLLSRSIYSPVTVSASPTSMNPPIWHFPNSSIPLSLNWTDTGIGNPPRSNQLLLPSDRETSVQSVVQQLRLWHAHRNTDTDI